MNLAGEQSLFYRKDAEPNEPTDVCGLLSYHLGTTMDLEKARIAAHRNNLARYRRILATPLTDLERAFIKKRMNEERSGLRALEQEGMAGSTVSARSGRAAAGVPVRTEYTEIAGAHDAGSARFSGNGHLCFRG
jgi:hypothetical protein